MGGLQLTLAVLALAASVKGQGSPPCWYESLCPFTEQDTSLTIPNTEADLDAQMDWCYAACVAAEAATPGDCTFFTVFTNRGNPSCKLLTSCQDADADAECLAQGTCNSGPGDCAAASTTVCDVLPPSVDPVVDEIPWQCDTVNPYSTPVPDGETCFLSCDGWVNRANGVQAVILSTCENGNWEPSALSVGVLADYPALPATLPVPNDGEGDQLACGCADEPMAWDHDSDDSTPGIVYDPNTLPGTTFLCNEDYLTGDSPIDFKITASMVCRLFCDGYHVATMSCQDGTWTGEPELGAWCYAAPTADDDLNG